MQIDIWSGAKIIFGSSMYIYQLYVKQWFVHFLLFNVYDKNASRAQQVINLEIPVLVRSLKSSNVGLGYYLDGKLFKCCLSAAANP